MLGRSQADNVINAKSPASILSSSLPLALVAVREAHSWNLVAPELSFTLGNLNLWGREGKGTMFIQHVPINTEVNIPVPMSEPTIWRSDYVKMELPKIISRADCRSSALHFSSCGVPWLAKCVSMVVRIQLALVSWSSVRNHRQLPGSTCWCRRMQVYFKIPLSCVCCCLWKQIWHLLSRSLDYWACTLSFSKCCEPVMMGRNFMEWGKVIATLPFITWGVQDTEVKLLVIVWTTVYLGSLSSTWLDSSTHKSV